MQSTIAVPAKLPLRWRELDGRPGLPGPCCPRWTKTPASPRPLCESGWLEGDIVGVGPSEFTPFSDLSFDTAEIEAHSPRVQTIRPKRGRQLAHRRAVRRTRCPGVG